MQNTTPSPETDTIETTSGPAPEHVLAVVEPTDRGDAALDVAHDVVARGGRASVLMVITSRVDDDIRSYAASEDLSVSEAEATALERLVGYCNERIGDDVPTIVERFGRLGTDIRRHISEDITSVAVPEGLFQQRSLDKMSAATGRPVVVAQPAA
jgi:hypothetical protein